MILFELVFDTLLALALTIVLLTIPTILGHVICAIAFVVFIVNLRKLLFFIQLRRLSNAARARYK